MCKGSCKILSLGGPKNGVTSEILLKIIIKSGRASDNNIEVEGER